MGGLSPDALPTFGLPDQVFYHSGISTHVCT